MKQLKKKKGLLRTDNKLKMMICNPVGTLGVVVLSGGFGTLELAYCIAHVSWDLAAYQGLFCPLNKPSCDRRLRLCTKVKSKWSGRLSIDYIDHCM